MNNHQPVKLRGQSIKPSLSPQSARRKLLITLLSVVIVSVMIAWFGFLGWGMIEILRSLNEAAKALWSMLP
jgi:hypothetical protein